MAVCRYCKKGGSDTVTVSYWNSTKHPCHSACKKAGERKEAFDCQSIDANCNDCVSFKRTHVTGASKHSKLSHGVCLKYDRQTTGSVNNYQGNECFKHRRII